MQDPFSSEYVSTTVTETSTTTAASATTTSAAQVSEVIIPAVSDAEPRAYGFEPERYGLGKPKRIVIRGKIARE